MKKGRGARAAALAVAAIAMVGLSGCADSRRELSADAVDRIKSYRDIPGVTEEEIAAIEALKAARRSFSYGSMKTTEAFRQRDGSIAGFSALFSKHLSELFGIPFIQKELGWDDEKSGIDSMTLDFASDMTATPERMKRYFMTHSIAERSLKIFTYGSNGRFQTEDDVFGLRLGFYGGTITAQSIINAYPSLKFETVNLFTIPEIVENLSSGRIDAFVTDAVMSVGFEGYPLVHSKEFFSFVYTPVSLTTGCPDLRPIISVVNKYIEAGGIDKLYELYRKGRYEYAKYELSGSYTDAEKAYIAGLASRGEKVPVGLEHDYYPVSFFNEKSGEFEGVVPDILKEINLLTGIEFDIVTDRNTPFYQILEMVNTGEAAFLSAMLMTPERKDKYLWSDRHYTSHYALISKIDHPFLEMAQVVRARIGVSKGTAYEEMYKMWFPNSSNLIYYNSIIDAMMALDRGEVDLVMASENALITMMNYFEKPGFMINIQFNMLEEAYFGFNLGEEQLASIIRKAQKYVAIDKFNKYWTNRVFDYERKLAEAQRPWLIGATALSLAILVLILALFYRNRSERRRLAKLVADQTSTITAIFDATPDLIFRMDLYSRFTELNASLEKHFNLSKPDILGKTPSAIGVPIDFAAQYMAIDNWVFDSRQSITVEEIIPSFDGKRLLFETIKSPLIQNGKVTGLVGMSREITQRKAIEEEAKNASEAKSRFIANMSHEMRTPMNVIVGLTGLMMEEMGVPDNIKETLEKINTAGGTLTGMINDEVAMSKIEAGKIELVPVRYDVPSLLNDIITLNIIRIENKPIIFDLYISDDMPRTLYGDDLRVKQIFNNLLSNAFKYTKEGSVTLSVDSRREDDTVWLSFYISDTGIGIRKEDMVKLFTDYNQVDTRANREIEGTGLGLSITKKFIELMDGEISVESEYGIGTTFRVRIRQGFVSSDSISKETVERLRSFSYSDNKMVERRKLTRADLSYARVLVVDDFPTNLDVAAGMLRKYKMRVDCVTSGQDAVDRISAAAPLYDAVFMDHMMPGMDGIEAAAAIRAMATEYAKKMPIIALTANAVAGNEEMFLNNGFDAFLPKPFSVAGLDVVVQRWVRDKSKEQRI
ncbi:MAG: transporter substrate-binding domain-containing protein [Chitinispirillales bacterium]|nr:transporter substrate-binding domain-containing protein [Chitinispirillales bacterium]